jgi:hypothetical protein
MDLPFLVCSADYGAIGTIVHLDENYFYLKVEKFVTDSLGVDTLKIQRFEDWGCGRRYDVYEIGQREFVFFKKSNYIIEDYELVGYGSGCEFELPIRNDSIYYRYSFSGLRPYYLPNFIQAVSDLGQLKKRTQNNLTSVSSREQQLFAAKSQLHKLFIECSIYTYEPKVEFSPNGYIINGERNYMYQDYENKIFISNQKSDKIFLSAEDAEVWKKEAYFIVKPHKGWTRRWVNVYSINDTKKSKALFQQLFDVIELPEPRIYFGNQYSDTIHIPGYRFAIPDVFHYLDDLHKDEYLTYELLAYTYQINSGGRIKEFRVKSRRLNKDLLEEIRKMQSGDIVTLKDIFVLYPNKTVKQLKDRTAIVWRSR